MRNRVLTLALLFCFNSNLSFAKEKSKLKDEGTNLETSAAHRQDKEFTAALELVGTSVAPIASFGLRAGYFLDSNSYIAARYAYGKSNIIFFDVKTNLTEVGWQRFWGNSFYTFLGIGFRDIAAELTLDLAAVLSGSESDKNASFGVTSYGISAVIGNQWQWENFTLGCDWFGAFIPLAKGAQRESGVDNSVSEEDKKEKQDSFDKLSGATTYELARFYIGVSF